MNVSSALRASKAVTAQLLHRFVQPSSFRSAFPLFRTNLPTKSSLNVQYKQYSTNIPKKPQTQPKKSEGLKFHYIIIVAVFSFVVLGQAVKDLDKNRQKNNFSEEEFAKLEDGLKRKVKMFTDEDAHQKKLTVSLMPLDTTEFSTSAESVNEKNSSLSVDQAVSQLGPANPGLKIVNINQLLEQEKSDPHSKYGPLIKECEAIGRKLPTGTKTSIVGAKIEALKKEDGNEKATRVLVVGFPDSINESIKFEEKIITVKKLIVFKGLVGASGDVVNYFNTVHKVKEIADAKEVGELV